MQTEDEAMNQGWVIPTRFNGNRAWIECAAVNGANWKIETVAVKLRHWSEQVKKSKAGEFIKQKPAMFVHWLRKCNSLLVM